MNNIIEVLGKDKIKSRARDLMRQSLLPERIQLIENLDYKLYVHDAKWGTPLKNVLTIILTSNGNNTDYFRESIESVLKQTNGDYELILVDHGCEADLKDVIYNYFLTNDKIKLITFEKNLYDARATVLAEERFSNVLNSALFCSDGEYVYFLSYDDFLSENYIECMVQLFLENPKCMVASPAVASVNEISELNVARTESLRQNNLRKKYMNGIDLATSVIHQQNLFVAPGGLCCYRTNMVLAAGGLDTLNDFSQIFKFSILGDIGTCKKAVLYWRHHDNQTNNNNKKVGALYYAIYSDWSRHIEMFYAANSIPMGYQLIFRRYITEKIHTHSLSCIRDSIRSGWKGAIGVLSEILRTAPVIYFFYFLMLFFIESPYMLYNSLPEDVRMYYRRVKRMVMLRRSGL